MKKLIAILMAALFVLTFAGCGEEEIEGAVIYTGTVITVFDYGMNVGIDDGEGGQYLAEMSYPEKDRNVGKYEAGQRVEITAIPQTAESYPIPINAVKIKIIDD